MGRLRDFNVIDVEDGGSEKIFSNIKYAMTNKGFKNSLVNCGKIYGTGSAAEKIIKILKNIELDDRLFEKKMTY